MMIKIVDVVCLVILGILSAVSLVFTFWALSEEIFWLQLFWIILSIVSLIAFLLQWYQVRRLFN